MKRNATEQLFDKLKAQADAAGLSFDPSKFTHEAHVTSVHNVDEPISYCVACGDVIDYCQGHGEIGDREGWAIIQQHFEHDIHDNCDPHGCDEGADCPEGPCAHMSHDIDS